MVILRRNVGPRLSINLRLECACQILERLIAIEQRLAGPPVLYLHPGCRVWRVAGAGLLRATPSMSRS
jgi:hypothetical protein